MSKLFQQSGGTSASRAREAWDIVFKMQLEFRIMDMTEEEQTFMQNMKNSLTQFSFSAEVSPKQLFYLRDLKDRYL